MMTTANKGLHTMANQAELKIFDETIFQAARACGSADKESQGKILNFGQMLLTHITGLNYKPAMEFFQSSDKTGNGGGKRIREDFLNGYASGRGWTSYTLAGDTEKATARKMFARAVESVAPKPAKAVPKPGTAIPKEVTDANQSSASTVEGTHSSGRMGIHVDSLAAFFAADGVLDKLFAIASGKEKATPNQVMAWITAATVAREAVQGIKKGVHHAPNH